MKKCLSCERECKYFTQSNNYKFCSAACLIEYDKIKEYDKRMEANRLWLINHALNSIKKNIRF